MSFVCFLSAIAQVKKKKDTITEKKERKNTLLEGESQFDWIIFVASFASRRDNNGDGWTRCRRRVSRRALRHDRRDVEGK